MSPAYYTWIPLLLIMFVLISQGNRRRRVRRIQNNIKKRKGSVNHMDNRLLSFYKGKKCNVYSSELSALSGTVKEIEDGWLTLEDNKGKLTTLNIDYISYIKEK